MNATRGFGKKAPVNVSEDDVRAAAEGRSEERVARLLAKGRPADLTEEEVRQAGEGRSESVLAQKHQAG